MAKQRHENNQSSKSTMLLLGIGIVLLVVLLGWALTRDVESESAETTDVPVADLSTGTTPLSNTSGGAATDPAGVPRISIEDLRQKLGQVVVIDVRDPAAYAAAHIPGSINLPFSSIEGAVDSIPKGKEIVTYCT